MLSDEDFCRALKQSVGTETYFVLARLTNAGLIRRSTSIPTAAAAAKRFEAAVFSATATWFAAGLLSDAHAALLFFDLPSDVETKIDESLAAFAFDDPWSRSGRVQLKADVAIIPLEGMPSNADVFAAAAEILGESEDGSELREAEWRTWCRDA
jgi:hypothetical protein